MRIGGILLLLAAASACASCGGRRPEKHAAPSGQTIVFSDAILRSGGTDTVRFGYMRSGEIAVKPLILHNASDRPAVVAECTQSCGCTTLEFDNQPILPGEKRAARMIFDARGLTGWQFKLLEVRFAGGRKPLKIYVEAEVE